jgi:hypothetical protein
MSAAICGMPSEREKRQGLRTMSICKSVGIWTQCRMALSSSLSGYYVPAAKRTAAALK